MIFHPNVKQKKASTISLASNAFSGISLTSRRFSKPSANPFAASTLQLALNTDSKKSVFKYKSAKSHFIENQYKKLVIPLNGKQMKTVPKSGHMNSTGAYIPNISTISTIQNSRTQICKKLVETSKSLKDKEGLKQNKKIIMLLNKFNPTKVNSNAHLRSISEKKEIDLSVTKIKGNVTAMNKRKFFL